ncbi:MAG: amino acid--[acyl-carrier-protein] ligase [Anaerolineales bacterium]|nr:amino acid--[acyl-carrier-protein] ligase [Anaerolineales bacterium]
MSHTHENPVGLQEKYQRELLSAGLLIESSVPGVYGRSDVFEGVIQRFEAYLTRNSRHLQPEVIHFPPILSRDDYLKTSHIETFPHLMGSLHGFLGNERTHMELLRKREHGENWAADLEPIELMMAPAACYPLYPTARDTTLPEKGRLIDLVGFVFRHEPSNDPARMQSFRQREFVQLGTPEQALNHRDDWIDKGIELYKGVGLDEVQRVIANDPFFGRGGRAMVVSQIEQAMKYELVFPITSTEKPTAIASSNYHMDHFSHSYNIKTTNGEFAHTACIGFGLERTALAMFKKFRFDVKAWPSSVKTALEL